MTRRRILRLLRVTVAVAILAWVAWSLHDDWATTAWPALHPAPLDVVVAAGSGAAALLGLALLYAAMLRATGAWRPGDLPWTLRTWFTGYFARYVPGKVALVVERARLGELAGIPRASSVVYVVWETLLLMVGAGLVATTGLALLGAESAVSPVAVWAAGLGSAALLLAFPPGLRFLVERSAFFARHVPHTVIEVPHRTQALLALGYAAVWLLFGLSFALTCRWFDVGQDAGVLTAFWYVASYVAGLVIAVSPAGLGVREGVLVTGLTAWPAPTVLAFALASRVLMTVLELGLLAVVMRVKVPDKR